MSSRKLGLLIIAVSTAVLAAAIPAFVSRARVFNGSREVPHLKKVVMTLRRFTAHGRDAAVTDAEVPTPIGGPALRLVYGDSVRLLPVKAPPALGSIDLLIYGEWLAMLRIIPVTPSGAPRPGATELDDRYILVVRQPPEGFDPDSWGSVRRKEWIFDFYELRPDGSIDERTYRWPLPESMMNFAAAEAELTGSAVDVERARAAAEQRRIARLPESIRELPELKERTVEYDAALYAIPKLSVPNYRFKDTAFNWKVSGWTLPAAGFSILGLLAGLAMVFAPRGRARSPTPSPAARG